MNFTSVFRAKRRLTSHSASEVADQSQVSGCLVTFGRCWPSAADEEWYSPKSPSSTVAVNELNTKVSAFFLSILVPARRNAFSCLLLRPSWDWTALPLFTPFVGPDGSSYHYGGRFLHLGAVTTQG